MTCFNNKAMPTNDNDYRVVAWIEMLSNISHIVSKFVNFRVAKINGNNGMFYGGTKYRHSSHKALP